jgi:anti-sigma factor RsiW
MRHASSVDARLTAYALGELRGEERVEVEARVERAPELRREVEAIREIGGLLAAAYAGEEARPTRHNLLRVAVAAAAMALAAMLLLVAWPRGGSDGAAGWDTPHDEVAVHASDGGPAR